MSAATIHTIHSLQPPSMDGGIVWSHHPLNSGPSSQCWEHHPHRNFTCYFHNILAGWTGARYGAVIISRCFWKCTTSSVVIMKVTLSLVLAPRGPFRLPTLWTALALKLSMNHIRKTFLSNAPSRGSFPLDSSSANLVARKAQLTSSSWFCRDKTADEILVVRTVTAPYLELGFPV